ncbi:MAG: DMT family transporter [Rhodospirillaceae bacterium]|jgi:drug/metabolite transporter (DMT)-like permease|nr:DMT family transporter [Rhodospirillaceae bacterium]MBT6406446.1 DMT family transporter [Rhodospirillaceae bacterium]MBT7356871.1 DMT family transporter [Rhodospirillaceae bacterium]
MTPPEQAHLQITPTLAIGMVIVTGVVLGGMDATAKFLAIEVPVLMVLWGRYFFHTVITFTVYAGRRRSLEFLRARRPGLQFIRAASLFGATSFMYVAITHMQLADASAIQFLAPVILTALSGLFLGEHVGPRRIAAVIFAFIGVLLIARPGSGVLGWYALMPLVTAVLLGIYMMMTRIIRTKDNPDSTTFYSTALGALVLTVLVPFHWQALTPFEWMLMTTMGAAGAAGHYMLVKAFHSAEASMLAPFTYSQVVAAIIWGFLIFGDIPSVWTFAGTAVIIGSGLYVWYRESRLPKETS